MKSIWESNLELAGRKPLQSNLTVQIVVIGAGIAGILTAYFLKERGHQVIVVETKEIAGGQTKGTTAKITSQHGMCYEKLIRKIGREKARIYAQANEEAISVYEQIIAKEKISCHFEKRAAYLYTVQESGKAKLQKEAEAARSLGIKAQFVEGKEITELPFKVSGAVCFENQAWFHPLAFIKHLSDKIEIFEHTKVLSVKKHKVLTDKGTITAQNIVFATHYPFVNLPGFYFLRQHQERSYVLALKEQKELLGMYYGIDKNGLSFRSAGDILLLGGGGHRTGKNKGKNKKYKNETCENRNTGYVYLRKMAQVYYPNAEEAAAWSAQDCMPHDHLPFIGKYSMLRPYWYVATGFKKWGMTSAMVAAITISNQICGVSHDFALNKNIFTPQRVQFRASIKNLVIDIGESIQGLGKGLFSKKKHRCPHMGCRLEWNAEESSWDCPCHGSRFDSAGTLQDNPAQIDLRK